MESRDVSRRTKEREGVALKEWKKEEGKKREEGKKEFWLKKCLLFFSVFFHTSVLSLFADGPLDVTSGSKSGSTQIKVRRFGDRQETVEKVGRKETKKDCSEGQEAHSKRAGGWIWWRVLRLRF